MRTLRVREEEGWLMWINLRRDIEAIFSRLTVPIDFHVSFVCIDTNSLDELRRIDTPERTRARSRAWKARNKERVAAYSRDRYAKKKRAA